MGFNSGFKGLNSRKEFVATQWLGRWASHRVNLTFRGPCIVIYSYNKTNEMN